jgi:hypothetical protein
MTLFLLPLKGFPNDSKVFLPITTGMPQVVFLKNFKSLGKCHGSLLSLPITLFAEAARRKEIVIVQN